MKNTKNPFELKTGEIGWCTPWMFARYLHEGRFNELELYPGPGGTLSIYVERIPSYNNFDFEFGGLINGYKYSKLIMNQQGEINEINS